MTSHPTPAAAAPTSVGRSRKAALASWIGSALEYYDFFIYGSASALIFSKLFFPEGSPALATIASLATFGVAYVARPFGSFLLGHIGDRFGRKRILFITLLGMGTSTFLIGLLPTYDQIGVLAPILLVTLRLCQGLAVAGEQSGAASMTLEHAPANRRAFYTSFTLGGTQAGFILATVVFLAISALPEEDLMSWGWRIPFLLSVVVMGVAYWIRRSLDETPAFENEQRRDAPKPPLSVLFRSYTADVLKVLFAALVSVISTIFGVFALTYGVETIGVSRPAMLSMQLIANVLALGAIPAWALLADRIGRRPVFIIGALGSAATIWPFIWSVSQHSLALIFTTGIVLNLAYSAYGGAGYAMFSEQFETKVRLSGVAVGTQFGFALGGFAPSVAAALAGPQLDNWVPVAIFTCATSVIATIAALAMRETYRLPLDQLGKSPAKAADRVSVLS